MTWRSELRSRWWPGDEWLSPTDEVLDWLATKYDVALRLAPRTIGEIGVRAGYSAFAMLSAAPEATFVGIDLQNPDQPGATAYARDLLAPFRAGVVLVDSHDVRRLPPFDLLHVDGDHTKDGCFADLDLAFASGVRFVLVDDYYASDTVRAAVEEFASASVVRFLERIDDGFRGSALLELHR